MVQMVRKHFVLPEDLAREFEEVVGERNQSAEVARLIGNWLRNRRFAEAVSEHAGFVADADHPEWATPEDIESWVRDLRAEERAGNQSLVLGEERRPGNP